MRSCPLGNSIDKAWLAGWDASMRNEVPQANPYSRRPQVDAWRRGHAAACRSGDADVARLQRTLRHRVTLPLDK